MKTVFLNGEFLPQDQATISVMDRGFLFGDGVYEVIPVYNDKLFRFEQHLERLTRSLAAIELDMDLQFLRWQEIFTKLMALNPQNGPNQALYFQITRGCGQERQHAFPEKVKPTLFALTMPLNPIPIEELSKGKKAILLPDSRWEFCYIKATSLLANVLLYQKALDAHVSEAILVRNHEVLEGSTSNVFIVKDHIIQTPPLSDYILGGITRELVLELAHENGLPCEEKSLTVSEVQQADEIWITSTTREIYPIVLLDEISINQGQPGPIWQTMIRLYRDFIRNLT